MVKKILVSYLLLIVIFTTFMTNIGYAKGIPVTEENLKEAFQKFILSEANNENYEIQVKNNVINITGDEELACILNYDLTNKPTFSIEVPIEKGMSYEDFQNETGNLILPILGFVAVANIQGVEFEDASAYILFSILGNSLGDALGGALANGNSYIIVDDLAEGSTVEKTDDPNIIYASQFGDRVMEYVNKTYSKPQITSDVNEFNTYSMTTKKIDISDTSCKLVATLSVNIDSDFSKLVGYTDKIEDSLINGEITQGNTENKKEDNKEDSKETVNLEKLPNTGNYNMFVNVLYMIIGLCSLCVIALIYNLNKR